MSRAGVEGDEMGGAVLDLFHMMYFKRFDDGTSDTKRESEKSRFRFLKQIKRNTPCVSALISKQFRARHVEDLPSVIPHPSILLAVRLLQMRPYLHLLGYHVCKPVLRSFSAYVHGTSRVARGGIEFPTHLASFRIMHAIDPPLPLDFEIFLKI